MNSKKPDQKSDRGEVFDKEPLHDKIGKNLKQMYDDVLNEPVPDDFLSLLRQADDKQSCK